MGQYLGLCCGSCLNGCVDASTYLHDKYTNWRYGSDDYTYWAAAATSITPQSPLRTEDIHTAVLNRSSADVHRILKQDPDASLEINKSSETALHAACRLGHLDVIKTILENSTVADVQSEIGSPLHSTIQGVRASYVTVTNGVLVLRALVSKGCHVDWRDRQGKTALFAAAEAGCLECLNALIDLGADPNLQESNLFSPLYIAAIKGDLKSVLALLDQRDRIKVDTSDSMSRTPLMAALITILNNLRYEKMPGDVENSPGSTVDVGRHNKIAIVEALLHAGANPNAVDYQGRTPLTLAFLILELDHIRTSVFANFNPFTQEVQPAQKETTAAEPYSIIVRLLLLHGGKSPEDWVKDYSKAPVWLQRVYETATCGKTIELNSNLMLHVRHAIRRHLAKNQKLHRINELPLPTALLNFTKIKYI